jgi:hypothetical protein
MGMEFWSRFLLAGLAIWRVGHLVAEEDGPWRVIVRVRRMAGHGFWGQLMDCFYCLSLWLAAPFAFWVADRGLDRVVTWLALSGMASLIYKLTTKAAPLWPAPAEGQDHGMLRTDASSADTEDHYQ